MSNVDTTKVNDFLQVGLRPANENKDTGHEEKATEQDTGGHPDTGDSKV